MPRATLVAIFILTGFSGSYAAQESTPQQSPLWTYQFRDNVEYFQPTPSGDLFVSSKSEMALVNAKTGEVVWSRNDIRDCKRSSSVERWVSSSKSEEEIGKCRYLNKGGSKFILLSNTPYALFTPKERVALLNWRTGATLFDSADHPLGKIREYRYISQLAQLVMLAEIKKKTYALAAIKAGDSELQWLSEITISKDFEWLGVREDGTALFYGKNRDGKRILTALNLNTGEVAWQNQDLLKENLESCCFAPAIYGTDETTLLFISEDGPMRLDTDGQLLWRAEDLADKVFSRGVAYADGVFFVAVRTKSFPITKTSVFAIDTSDGSIIWKKEFELLSIPIFEIHPKGLLIASGGFAYYRGSDLTRTYQPGVLALLDLQTGRGWTRTMPVGWRSEWLSLSRFGVQLPFVVGDDAIYYVNQQSELIALDPEDGSLNTITRYNFMENESPTSLSLIDGNLFLNSSYNFAGFDSGGQSLYQRFYKAPGPSNWAKAGAIAQDSLAIASGYPDSLEGEVKFDNVRETWAKRYGTAVDTRRFSYTHIEAEKYRKDDDQEFALVLFDKYAGKEVGRLWLNKRTPEFAVDPFMQTVFWKSSKKVIQALEFESVMDYEVESADESPAYVFFYRTRWNGLWNTEDSHVSMDSRPLVSLDRGRYVGFEVRPGSHLFTSTSKDRNRDAVVSIEMEPGNYYCINVDMGMDVHDTELKLETVEKCGKEIPKLQRGGGIPQNFNQYRVYEWPDLTP